MRGYDLVVVCIIAVAMPLVTGCGCNGPQPASAPTAAMTTSTIPAAPTRSPQADNEARERQASWQYLLQARKLFVSLRSDGKIPGQPPIALFVADDLDRLGEDDVALECLMWGHRCVLALRYTAHIGSGSPTSDEERLRWSIEAASVDQELLRLVSKYQPKTLPTLPVLSRPAITTAFRASKAGKGKVLVYRNSGTTEYAAVQVKVNARPAVEAGPLAAWQEKEAGWLELGHPLQPGDVVELWANGSKILTVNVP